MKLQSSMGHFDFFSNVTARNFIAHAFSIVASAATSTALWALSSGAVLLLKLPPLPCRQNLPCRCLLELVSMDSVVSVVLSPEL